MSASRKVVYGGALSAASVCVSMAALLVTGKLFTNALDQDAVGVFALALAASDFMVLLAGLGLSVSLPKLVAEADDARRRGIIGGALLGQMMVLAGLSALVVGLYFLLRGPARLSLDPAWAGLHAVLFLLPLLFVVGAQRDLIMAALAGLDRYAWRAGGIVAASLAQVVLVYIVVWRLGGGVAALILAMAASYAAALVLLWGALGRLGRPILDLGAYKQSVVFSLPLYANQLLSFFYQRFDTVLVAALLGPAQAAVFEMIKRLPVIMNRILGALMVPYLPQVASLVALGERAQAAVLLKHMSFALVGIGYAGLWVALLARESLIRALFSAEYLSGTIVLAPLLTAAVLLLQAGLMGQTLIALGKGVLVTLINVGMVLLSIGGNLVLAPRFGLVGAGVAAVVAILFSNGMQTLCVRKNGVSVSVRDWAQLHLVHGASLLVVFLWPGPPGRAAGLTLFALLAALLAVLDADRRRRLSGLALNYLTRNQ